MTLFRDENRFFIYYVNFFGLYLKSIEKLTGNKWLIGFLTVWTKIPLTVMPIYLFVDLKYLLFEKTSFLLRIAMLRKITAYSFFYIKVVLFHFYRNRLEDLINLWDASFKEEFYTKAQKLSKINNKKENLKIVRMTMALANVTSLIYTVPQFFSKTKEFSHPTGIPYIHQSPVFEFVVFFDVCGIMSCVAGVIFDCTLMVFLSHIRAKLNFLRDALADILDEVIIDEKGRLMMRRIEESAEDDGSFNLGYYEETDMNTEDFRRNLQNIEKKLRIWTKYHQDAIRFFEEIKKVYTPIASLQLFYTVLYSGLTAFHIVQTREGLAGFGILLTASINFMSLFIWSKLGADIREIQVFSEAFGRGWFLFPTKIKVAFLFISMRCKKPLTLFGMYIYGIHLVTFYEILRVTYQFSAFLMQMIR